MIKLTVVISAVVLSHFFNNLGHASNVTSASSYEFQSARVASIGTVFSRSQLPSIQIPHIDLPKFRSGGGGIELFDDEATASQLSRKVYELMKPIEEKFHD